MPLIDITGQKFHRLTAISYAGVIKGRPHWNVRCDCGNEFQVRGESLKTGNTKSCGCQKIDSATKHGHNPVSGPSKTYVSWMGMIARCTKPKHAHYERYGGKGITVCERWIHSFDNFLADMGERPQGKTLDRIDNSKGYEPDNCRWATHFEQSQNRCNTPRVTYGGETKTLSEWSRQIGIPRDTLYDRFTAGWSDERIVTTPKELRKGK